MNENEQTSNALWFRMKLKGAFLLQQISVSHTANEEREGAVFSKRRRLFDFPRK